MFRQMSLAPAPHHGRLLSRPGCDAAANPPHLERRREQWLVGGGKKGPLFFAESVSEVNLGLDKPGEPDSPR